MENQLKKMTETVREQYNRVLPPVTNQIGRREEMVASSDGVKLRTIIFSPEQAEQPLPVIVIRSCYYASSDFLEVQATEMAKRGFAAVIQWCRGIGGSEGEWQPYVYERQDGMALMEWLQEEAWVKNIGLVGASYLALTGWYIADRIPEKVKTMYLTVMGTENHISLWQEGSFRQDIYTSWSMENTGKKIDAEYMESASYRPQIQVDEDLWGCHLDWYRDEISKPSRIDPFRKDSFWGWLTDVPSKMKIPVFVGEGWYDIHLGNALKTFENLSEESKKHSVLQVMPGNHSLTPVIFGQEKQENASICEFEQQLRWFYNILVKEELPEFSVNYYIIGEDKWKKYSQFPIEPSLYKEFYLGEKVLTDEPSDNSCREYEYDPENPVPSWGGATLFKLNDRTGSRQQPDPDWRKDVLSYLSDPLKEDLEITGSIQVNLWVESSAPDTCFAVKLMEVFENGEAYNIRNGITTLGFRNGADTWQEYKGGPVEIRIQTWDIAWKVKKGSRLRLDISSSNFPEYSVHPNTTRTWSLEDTPQKAHQKILSGMKYPSKIILPLNEQ